MDHPTKIRKKEKETASFQWERTLSCQGCLHAAAAPRLRPSVLRYFFSAKWLKYFPEMQNILEAKDSSG